MAAILELVMDPTGAVAGARIYQQSTDRVVTAAARATAATGTVSNAMKASAATTATASATIVASMSGIDQAARQTAGLLRDVFTFVVGAAAIGAIVGSLATFEDALVSVGKTTNTTGEELQRLGDQFQALSLPQAGGIPVAAEDLLEIGAAAGQLGVRGSQNILAFSETIARLAASTDVVGEEGARSLARVIALTGESVSTVATVGSVLARLGDEFAAADSQILKVSESVAATASQFRLSSTDVFALGAALRASGAEADAGGTAIRRVLSEITQAAARGGSELRTFASVAGTSIDEFRGLATTGSPLEALTAFLRGLGQLDTAGQISALESVGLNLDRVSKVISPLANRFEILERSIASANDEAADAQSLTRQSNAAYATLGGSLQGLSNTFRAAFLQLRNFDGAIKNAVDTIRDAFDASFELTTSWEEATPAARNLARAVEGLGAIFATSLVVKLGGVVAAAFGSGGFLLAAVAGFAIAFRRELFPLADFTNRVFLVISGIVADRLKGVTLAIGVLPSAIATALAQSTPALARFGADISAAVGEIASGVRALLGQVASDFASLFVSLGRISAAFVATFVPNLLGQLRASFNGASLFEVLREAISGDSAAFERDVAQAFARASTQASFAANRAAADIFGADAVNEATDQIESGFDRLAGAGQQFAAGLSAPLGGLADRVNAVFASFAAADIPGIRELVGVVGDLFEAATGPQGGESAFSSVTEALRELLGLSPEIEGLTSRVSDLEQAGKSFGRSFTNALADVLLQIRSIADAARALAATLFRSILNATIGSQAEDFFGGLFGGEAGEEQTGGGSQPLTIGPPSSPTFFPNGFGSSQAQAVAAGAGGGGFIPSSGGGGAVVNNSRTVVLNVAAQDVGDFVRRERQLRTSAAAFLEG